MILYVRDYLLSRTNELERRHPCRHLIPADICRLEGGAPAIVQFAIDMLNAIDHYEGFSGELIDIKGKGMMVIYLLETYTAGKAAGDQVLHKE